MVQIKKKIGGGYGAVTVLAILVVMALMSIVQFKGTYPLFGGEQASSIALNLTLDQTMTIVIGKSNHSIS